MLLCCSAALLCSRCTLHPAPWLACTKPEITQDGNVTVPIVGGMGSEDGESTKPDIIQDSNATVPIIVGGVGNEEGRDSGVTSVLQDDEGVVRHRITVTMEELTTHQHFFGEEQSVMVIASDARESASKTQADDDDSTHGKRHFGLLFHCLP